MKRVRIAVFVALLLFLVYFFGCGFLRNPDVALVDYTVSGEGDAITLRFSVISSAGYLREARAARQQGGKLCIDCYYAFGGFNGKIGARTEFTLPLLPDTEIIAVWRGDAYQEILHRNADGVWERPWQY